MILVLGRVRRPNTHSTLLLRAEFKSFNRFFIVPVCAGDEKRSENGLSGAQRFNGLNGLNRPSIAGQLLNARIPFVAAVFPVAAFAFCDLFKTRNKFQCPDILGMFVTELILYPKP